MTRSSTNELFTPYKEPEREFRSSRRHFKTLSLDELRSPDFNLLSDQEYSEEEEAKAMAETMEQYMSKTRTDYGSGVARPKIDNKDQFELKGQFLKELRENTFSGSDNEDANEHIEKVLEIVDLFHVPNITVDQLMLRVFPISLTGAASRWLRNEPTGSIKTWEDLKTKFLNKYCPPGRTAKKMEEINNFQQEPDPLSSMGIKNLTETSNGLAAIQAQLNNLRRDIKKVNEKVYAAQVGCEQCRGPNYTKYCPLKEEWKTLEEAYYTQFGGPFQGGGYRAIAPGVCFDNALVELGASVSVMPFLTYLNLGLGELAHTKLTVELADKTVKYPKGIAENILVRIGKFTFPVDFIILDMPEDVKVPLILGRPFLSTAHAKINVYKRKITLRVGEEKIIFKSVKPASSLIKRVYMLSLRERMELDLEARLMGETLVINRSLDPLNGDYIKLNDLNEPLELRRNQGDDLMPTIEEGEVIEEFRTRDANLDTGIDDYPSYYDNDKKIHIDYAHNLKFSCMIGFEFTHVNFFLLLYVNVMSKKFHNSIMKDKMVYKGDNVVGALMNVPIFVGTFSVVTEFAVLKDMDAYRGEEMGDVIVGEPFLREVGIKA
ncbi:putative reverse transcriptase domain-containing protein [Tanacetum coccineum]